MAAAATATTMPQDSESSVALVLRDELRVYELHLVEKQKRILQQFEATAAASRTAVVAEEQSRAATAADQQPDAAHMQAFEENLDREIDVQRSQLMATLADNRAAKLSSYKRELNDQIALMHQQQQQQQQQQQAELDRDRAQYAQATQLAHEAQREQERRAAEQQQRIEDTRLDVTLDTAEQQRWRRLEEEHIQYSEQERLSKEAHEAHIRSAEAERKQQRHEPQEQARPAASPIHRYQPNPSPQQSPSFQQPAPTVTKVSPTRPLADPEAELRRQWAQLQQELHNPSSAPAVGPPTHSAHPQPSPYQQPSTAAPSFSPPPARHMQHVAASPASGAPSAAATQHTLAKVESALEMDWADAWESLKRQPPHRAAHEQTERPHYPPPQPSPQYRAHPSAQASPSYAPPRGSPVSAMSPPRAPSQPAHLLQQAGSLFKTTLHELEEKSEYLIKLIAAFKDAEREMDSSVAYSQAAPSHQHSHVQTHQPLNGSYSYEYAAAGQYSASENGFDDGQYHELDAEADRGEYNDEAYEEEVEQPRQQAPRRSSSTTQLRTAPVAASRPRVAFAPAARPRTAAPAAAIRSASTSRPATYPPTRKSLAPAPVSNRKPTAAATRPASASVRPGSSAPRASISAPPAALSYPRPRTASARASLALTRPPIRPPVGNGVRQARSRIRAIVDKTRVAPTAVSVLSHPKPTAAYIPAPEAKGGLRRASVQEVLRGADEIAARKSMPAHLRPNGASRAPRVSKDPADEYSFVESTNEHPHAPLSMVRAAQREASQRLTTHNGYAPSPVAHAPSSPEYSHSGLDDSNGVVDLNTTDGLMQQEAVAQARHDGQLEHYLAALRQPTGSVERQQALERLAAKAAEPAPLYQSPLRQRHRAQQETFSHRSDAIVRGSHANAAPPAPVQQQSAMSALQDIIQRHHQHERR